MIVNDFFDPVSLDQWTLKYLPVKNEFGRNIKIHTANEPITTLENIHLAILGVPEDRNATYKGSAGAPDLIRQHLYHLSKLNKSIKIVDFGNLKSGPRPEDSYYGLQEIVSELVSKKIVPIILGGSQDLTYGIILGFERLGKAINLVTIDSKIDLNSKIKAFASNTYLQKIFQKKTSYLFNYTNIGHQSSFVDRDDLELIKNLYYEAYRLGEIRRDLKQLEPVFRDADVVSMDMGVLKQADSPGYFHPSPNGFYSEEACQLAKYCGLSDHLSVFFLGEIYPELDHGHQTSQLAAEIVWYFIEGFSQRLVETPDESEYYTKFIVTMDSLDQDLIFYKSEQTDRWWIEIPPLKNIKGKKRLIACSHEDYLMASQKEIPDRWWKAYQKIN